MAQFLQTETLIIELLLVVSLVAILVHRLRIPYTAGLVVVGLLLTLNQPVEINLTPELILALFVPPLVFEAAFHLDVAELERNLRGISVLAVPGVILTTLIVGGLVAVTVPLSLPVALLFGALISATDPIAVVALFRSLGAPKRLRVLVEGESLLNDGTAIVTFTLAAAAAASGGFDMTQGIVDFVRVAAGGVLLGLSLGWLISRLIARLDDYLIETTLTTVLAFGSYLIADRLGLSGVLAVVAAGLVTARTSPSGMSPTTRIVLSNFWEYVAFLANSLVFLLIGLHVRLPDLLGAWVPVVWAIGAVLAARVVVIYGLAWLMNHWLTPVPLKWQHVLTWGGLRGAISLALALSLPDALGPNRTLLQIMTFGVVLFTILVQGTTMRPLLARLALVTRSSAELEYERRHARLVAVQSAERHIDQLHREGLVSGHAWHALKGQLSERTKTLADSVREVLHSAPDVQAREMDTARVEMLRAEKMALQDLLRDGVISDQVFDQLNGEVDAEITGDGDREDGERVEALRGKVQDDHG